MSRVPIKVRITLAFAVAMACVLAATGAFLYLRFETDLTDTIDQALLTRAGDVAAAITPNGAGLSEVPPVRLTEPGESLAQIVNDRGAVIDATVGLPRRPIVSARQLVRARNRTVVFETGPGRWFHDRTRVLAAPVRARGRQYVVIVGASVDSRADSLRSLRTLLAVGGGAALLLASAAGYLVVSLAFRPVERMRRRAGEISAREPGERLPVRGSHDELARLGQTLNDMLARLELALQRERAFVADASHELRTPLAILKTELELALGRGRSPEELAEAVRSAAEETERLVQLAEDLLLLARSDDGRLPLERERVDARALLGAVRERFSASGRRLGREIEVEPGEPLFVRGDAGRLEQAVGNLVDNALRHGAGPIALRARQVDGAVELHVEDGGGGFPAEFLPHAFERFTRADRARGRGGTGLGLAIVDAIARAHGGAARAANGARGADVSLSIPAG